MYRALLALSVFVFLGCEADPGLKKIPQGDPRLVKKGVNLNFYPMVDILFVIDDSGSMDDASSFTKRSETLPLKKFGTSSFKRKASSIALSWWLPG